MIKRSLGLDKTVFGPASAENGLGSGACADTELLSKTAYRNSFFIKLGCSTKSTCAGSWRKDDDQAQISKPPPLGRARKLKLFSNMARRATLARPTKSTRAGSCATTDDRAQFSQPPPSYGSLRNPITGVPVRGN